MVKRGSSYGLTGQKYSVVWATLRQAALHALHLYDEPTMAQTLLEFPSDQKPIFFPRPYVRRFERMMK